MLADEIIPSSRIPSPEIIKFGRSQIDKYNIPGELFTSHELQLDDISNDNDDDIDHLFIGNCLIHLKRDLL